MKKTDRNKVYVHSPHSSSNVSSLKAVSFSWLFHPGFMVQHFANLSLSCPRGQPEGLITDLRGLYGHASTTPPPTVSMKDGLLASQGAPMRPWSWLKHRLMGVIYCMALVCVLRALFTCACLSRTLAPAGSWPHNPTPIPRPCNGSCGGMRRRKEGQDGCHFFLLDVSPL